MGIRGKGGKGGKEGAWWEREEGWEGKEIMEMRLRENGNEREGQGGDVRKERMGKEENAGKER